MTEKGLNIIETINLLFRYEKELKELLEIKDLFEKSIISKEKKIKYIKNKLSQEGLN